MVKLEYIPDKAQAEVILGNDDDKADASVLIGGSMTDKFVPIIYAGKWNKKGVDEAWVSINRKDVIVPKGEFGTFRDGRMELVIGNSRDTYYITPSGRLEYEISFNDSLFTHIDLELNFPAGMSFWKQLALTEGEVAEGQNRPEDVIDSYVFQWWKRNNDYKTGKLFHLYRQFLSDANGNKVWCDQEIDGNILRIFTGNEEWLKHATYPITIGPNLGYDTAGGSQASIVSTFYVQDNTDTTGGNVQNFHVAVFSNADSSAVKIGLYNDSGPNLPNVLLEQIEFIPGVSNDESEPSVDQDLLTGSTEYWIGLRGETANPVIKFDTIGGGDPFGRRKSPSVYATEMSDPANSNSTITSILSIWIDYAPAVGGNPWYYYAQQ